MYLLRFCIFIIFVAVICDSQNLSDESRLHKYLFSNEENKTENIYNPRLRPVKDSSHKIIVDVRMGVKRLFEMDETNHRVIIFAVLVVEWKDEFLNWNPNDFGNITYTYVDYWKIWTPHLTLVSKYIDPQTITNDNSFHQVYENYPVKVYSDGQVEFVPTVHLSNECLFNYGRFPFEMQVCLFYFQLPYHENQVDFKMASFFTKEYFNYNMVWSIEDIAIVSVEGDHKRPVNVLQAKFRRKYRNYMFTIPSYVVYILTLLMFLLPQQSNQRIIIGAICLVITTLLCNMMSHSFPHSDIASWPLLGKLYLFNIIMITFSILFSTFIVNISQTEHQKSVPDWLKKLTVNFLSKIFCIQAVAYSVFSSYTFKVHDDENVSVQEHITSQMITSSDEDITTRHRQTEPNSASSNQTESIANETRNKQNFNFTKLLKKTMIHLEQLRYKLQRETYKKCKNNEWLLVGILMDKICFLIYCSIIIISTMTIFKT